MSEPGVKFIISAETEEAAAALQEFADQAVEGFERLTGFGDFFAGLAGQLAAAFSVERLVEWTSQGIEAAASMGLLAQKTGIGVEQLSRLQAAFAAGNVSAEKFQFALRTLADLIGRAAQGDQVAAATLAAFGITARTVDGALLQIADRFHGMQDGVQKTTEATQLFGRMGEDLIPVLNKGSAGIKELGDQAEASGRVISEDMVQAAEKFESTMGQLRSSFSGFFIQLGQQVLPALQALAGALLDAQTKGTRANDMAMGLGAAFRALSAGLLGTYNIAASVAEIIGSTLAAAVENARAEIDAFVSLVGRAVQVLRGMFDVVKGLAEEMTKLRNIAAFAANPVAGAAGLAGNASVGQGVGEISGALKGAVGDVSAYAQRAWGIAASIGKQAVDSLAERWSRFAKIRDQILGAPAAGGTGGGSEGGSLLVAPLSPADWTEASKLIDQIEQKWREATQTQEELLDREHEKVLENLRDELQANARNFDELETLNQVYLQEKEHADETYQRKLEALRSKQKEEELDFQRSELAAKKDAITGDADLTEIEKQRELIPVLQAENQLYTQQEALLKQRLQDAPGEEERLKVSKELLNVETQRVKTAQELKAAEENESFFGNMRTQLVGLSNEWGNLEKNMATTLAGAIKSGVNGVSDAIMGAIEHTKTWGQVFLQVGQAILASLIKVVVQWIANKTIIAAMNALFATEQSTQAATLAASWAPAAMAASIATEGEADAAGEAGYWSAMGSADAGSFFAEGGMVDRPTLAMIGEGGEPEIILPTSKIASFFAAVQAGALTARGLSSAAIASLPRFGGGGGANASRGTGASSAGGQASPTINVGAPAVHVAVLNSAAEIARHIRENPHVRRAVLDVQRQNKLALGVS